MKVLFKTKISIIIVLLIVFLVLLNLTNFSKDVKNFFYFVSAPIQETFWGAGDKVSDFFEVEEINRDFKLKVQKLNVEIARLRNLKQENEALRKALGLDIQKEFEISFAGIISKDVFEDSILINVGVVDGISKDMPVISPQKVFLGRISRVYDNFSRVMLVSNKESTFPINIQGEAGKETSSLLDASSPPSEEGTRVIGDTIEAVIKGRGNFQVKVIRIPLEAEIKKGDRVVTSVLGGLFPSGILIGYIGNIERLGVEMFQQAEIIPAADIRKLRKVFIITEF